MQNSWICVDASLVVRLVADPEDETVRDLWERWDSEGRLLAAPALIYYEVANALYQYQRLGMISLSSARLALLTALSLPIRLHSDTDLHEPALELSQEFSFAASYDAHYLVLAKRLEAEFWTTDGRLAKAVRKRLPWVHLARQLP